MNASLDPAAMRGAIDLSSLVRPPSAAGAPGSRPPAASAQGEESIVREADDASFGAVLELSRSVPVIVEFYAAGIAPALEPIVSSYGGQLALVTVDGNRAPQVAQAFQVQQVPAVAAVIGGRPLQLFVGIPAEAEIRRVFDEILDVAAQQGISGSLGTEPTESEPADEPLPPLHQEAYDAIARGDYAAAAEAYRSALSQNPRDADAVAGLAQVSLLQRLQGVDAHAIRADAADRPTEVSAQLAVADLDVSGGHVDDAFGRLLDLFLSVDAESRTLVRTRLLEYFEIVGADDARTVAARRRLSALLY
jgi:putative thioredoxin